MFFRVMGKVALVILWIPLCALGVIFGRVIDELAKHEYEEM